MTEESTETATTTATSTSGSPTELDLAFIIDATGSMGSYISSAQENMRNIIQDIVISERCLLNVALILYRDHPPQDSTFITQVHDFTDDAEKAKSTIDSASAAGGGDGPEAMTPALYAAVHTLSWRTNAVKIAVLIADAPPHGLETCGDTWPNGDPSGHDPMECTALLAERGITLYMVGCEPAAAPYRDVFMAFAFKTGGQYIPLNHCSGLASVITGSAKEEISLEKLIAQVHEEVMREAASRGGPVDEAELTRRIHEVMQSGGAKARRLKVDGGHGTNDIPALTPAAEHLSTLTTLKEVREKWTRNTSVGLFSTAPAAPGLFGLGRGKTRRTATIRTKKTVSRPTLIKKKSTKVTTLKVKKPKTTLKTIVKKKSTRTSTNGSRRSLRLTLNDTAKDDDDEEEKVSTDTEEMETSTPIVAPTAEKPTKMKTEISHIELADDELLDVSQTRRLVRKCVARNKLKTT